MTIVKRIGDHDLPLPKQESLDAAGTGPVRSQLTTVMPYFTETADKLGPI